MSAHRCDFCEAPDVPAVAVLVDCARVSVEARACESHLSLLGPRWSADVWVVVLDRSEVPA